MQFKTQGNGLVFLTLGNICAIVNKGKNKNIDWIISFLETFTVFIGRQVYGKLL